MIKKNSPILISALVIAFGLFVHSAPVLAQNGVAVKVQPSTVEEALDPGAIAEGELTVTNQNGGRQTYFIGTRNITGMDINGRPDFSDTPSTDPLEAASWIKPLRDSFALEVDESATVPYRIEVPNNASPGSYYAAIFVTREAETTTESGAGVGFNVAALFNIRITGDAIEGLKIAEFYTDNSFYSKPHVLFTTVIENTGTVHQRPKGIVTIVDMLGNEVDKMRVNKQAGGVMPHMKRSFEETWDNDSFSFGKYTATLSVVYGETSQETLTRKMSFWIVPIKEVGILFGSIALLIICVLYLLRAYVRRQLRKAGHTSVSKQESSEISFARRMARTLTRLLVILLVLFIGIIIFSS